MPRNTSQRMVAMFGKGGVFAIVALTVDDTHNAVGVNDPLGKEPRSLRSFETSAEAYRYFADTVTISKLYGSRVLYLGRPNFG